MGQTRKHQPRAPEEASVSSPASATIGVGGVRDFVAEVADLLGVAPELDHLGV